MGAIVKPVRMGRPVAKEDKAEAVLSSCLYCFVKVCTTTWLVALVKVIVSVFPESAPVKDAAGGVGLVWIIV